MALDRNRKGNKKPISYFYNPYYRNESTLSFLEVWQILDDDVLGTLYPWQYVATAETSDRIVTLNFHALKHFEKEYEKYSSETFIYKVSARLLKEGNVHRLGGFLKPNLILCFDIYQLEKFGDKEALVGLKYLRNLGATLMIEGIDRAPVDVLLKYPVDYFLLDYRYYNSNNKGLVSMLKQIADTNGVVLVVSNVNTKDNISLFTNAGIEIFAGTALNKAKKKVEALTKKVDQVEVEDIVPVEKGAVVVPDVLPEEKEIKKKFLVQAESDKPEVAKKEEKVEQIQGIIVEQPMIEQLQKKQKELKKQIVKEKQPSNKVLIQATTPRPMKGKKKIEQPEKEVKEVQVIKEEKPTKVSKNPALIVAPSPRPTKRRR